MAWAYANATMPMNRFLPAALIAATLALPFAADAQPERRRRSDQNFAYDQTRRGEIKPLREIENRVLPRMGGARYLGPELYDDRYRLKFMSKGSVIWVDVDPRTGAIIGRAGD
ncbi:hypothetical protein [Sphingomonas jatrophae]|uniref:Peptidase propeptide and YPEB domain-containing protein n=1 Tax=Sphingomonas jatrophae TaxID=1166337 RepID=A0A1I6JLN0_9SPHN|nr:hypothetical protein [Sphingomonas jatrophae]SFR79888.1 hypothetical protein SAMN05192580_0484 [Sphingomonas jatrophae]